ncbi:MAG: ExeA family protein [Methylococcales bacterium]|nr:ExeA family protein [Methylococcales bacterium]
MYLKHFSMAHFPFDHSATPETLFAASAQAEAEVRIKHLIELRGIGLITGESGSGKTSICRTIAQSLHPGLYRLLYISLTTGNVLDMYRMLAWELGLSTQRNRASAFRNIREEVTRLIVEGKQLPILVIDEAHHLRNEVLEDLRLLTNYNMDSVNRLCILLVGLTELRRRLGMAVHESLDQRIVMRYHLSGLSREELPQYLSYRLQAVGCELPLFDPGAIEAIYQATQAMPRKVNRLAHYALTSCAIDKQRNVTPEHVQKALEELSP